MFNAGSTLLLLLQSSGSAPPPTLLPRLLVAAPQTKHGFMTITRVKNEISATPRPKLGKVDASRTIAKDK